MSVPNLITIFRILLVPLTMWLIVTGKYLPAFLVFIVAGISDGIDGFVAKKFNQVTELGTYLDPLADKLLLVSIYLAMGFLTLMPPLLVITVVSRHPDYRSCAAVLAYGPASRDATFMDQQTQYDGSNCFCWICSGRAWDGAGHLAIYPIGSSNCWWPDRRIGRCLHVTVGAAHGEWKWS